MTMHNHAPAKLAADDLRPNWPVERIPWEDSTRIPRSGRLRPAQPRALSALELGLHIRNTGYNIFLSGDPDLGRTYMLCNFLDPKANKEPIPPDLLYVNNFADEDHPCLIQLPAGQGKTFKQSFEAAIAKVKDELAVHLDSEAFSKKRRVQEDKFRKERAGLVEILEDLAAKKGFALEAEDLGTLALFPMLNGQRMSDEDIGQLDAPMRLELKRRSERLLHQLSAHIRKLSRLEKEHFQQCKEIERNALKAVLDRCLLPVERKMCRMSGCEGQDAPLNAFFANVRKDMLEHVDIFLPRDPSPVPAGHAEHAQAPECDLGRYDINLFVDNSLLSGAPVVIEPHPTFSNLLGSIEREVELGVLTTDFTLVKAGSLHRANGGYLIMQAKDLLQFPPAWEGLMRALRSGMARLEDMDMLESSRSKSIEPEPVPLNIKVILVGEEGLYEHLLYADEMFAKLFKIKAQMTTETEKNAANVRSWLCQLARIMDANELLPFDRGALAGLVDYGSELCEDRRKLSLHFPLMREILIESSATAELQGKTIVDPSSLHEALLARRRRSDLNEELYMEEYDRNIIKIRTTGSEVGCVNGLAVTTCGDYEFGLPHQISCTVGVGHGGIVDLEREAELGGPIHTKAMMILKSYLTSQFAHNKPLVLTGSICFEQSYSGIEGDSASGAELAALLSAISGVPVRLSLAFTGALSQSGQVMAVGGVTRKIEGFFELCSRRGLTGEQGVILPRDNVEHLMLREDVIQAVREGKFAIYPVSSIAEALELLTGMPAGRRRKDGTFAKGTLFERVDSRLSELAWLAENGIRKKRSPSSRKKK
jgi:predicted ATP-dependent protease